MTFDELIESLKTPTQPAPVEPAMEPTIEIPEYMLTGPEIVGYQDSEFQSQIYGWVTDMIVMSPTDTVKDYGCGRGDFGVMFDRERYTGIDQNPLIVAAGQKKYPNQTFIVGNYLDVDIETDHTVCIGTLNTYTGTDKWEMFDNTLQKALETTRKSVVFVLCRNTELEGYLDYPLTELFHHIPTELPIQLDYSRFEDIYVLVVHKQPFS